MPPDHKRPINRSEFLEYRMAYLAHLRDEAYHPERMIDACNLTDVGQITLLLMTWDDKPDEPVPGHPAHCWSNQKRGGKCTCESAG